MKTFWQKLAAAGRKGFTMVELLVVVAILGILSVVAISALDPIEQINKGRDTTSRSNATEVAQAIDRWYANTQMFPWNDAAAASSATAGTTGAPNLYTFTNQGLSGQTGTETNTTWDWLGVMETGGELKTGFTNRVRNSQKFAVLKAASSSVTSVCFVPTSKAFKKEAITRCTGSDAPAAVGSILPCASTPAATGAINMICVP